MAKLPGTADLGPTPAAPETRPVGAYDVSGFARGGAAIAQGAERLGQGIEKAGQGAGELATDISHWQYGVAHSQFLTQKVDLDAATAQDTNYGSDASGKTFEQRYTEKLKGIQSDAAAQIGTGPLREYFLNRTAPVVEDGIVRARAHATGLENNASIAYVDQIGNKTIDQAVSASDDATRQQLIDSHNQLVDGLVAKGAVSAVQGVQMKQNWAHQYATADILARSQTDPEGVINELRAAPGSNAAITNRILRNEGTGKNAASSATGAGQFINSTWLDVLKRNRPDLAAGKSDDELLALRADKTLGAQMTEAYRSENEAYLRRQGIDPTPGAQYLAHFLGPGAAVAVLKGDPNKPVSDVLASVVGKDTAAKMVAANPSILAGQLTGSVRQWADAKMGGATPGGGSLYDMLRPDVRETALAHAEQQLHRQSVDSAAGFGNSVKDDLAEADRTGTVTKPKGLADFVGAFGADRGPQAYASYQQQLKASAVAQSFKDMPQDQIAAAVKSFEPQPGAPGYADAARLQDHLQQRAMAVLKARKEDAAQYALDNLPAVREAADRFDTALRDPQASPEARTAMARDLATKQTMEQTRLGISPDNQAIVPKAYATAFNRDVAKAMDSDDPTARTGLIARVQREAATWGSEYWPQVMKQIAPDSPPVVRAVAAGADTVAMERLLSLPKDMTAKKIVGEENETTLPKVSTAVNTAMAPYLRTMVGAQKDRDFPGYRDLAVTLAALHVRDGDDADAAASKAFNELVGNRFDIKDTFRIPKSAGVPADDVQAGAQAARSRLGELGAAPPVNDLPGRSPEAVAEDLRIMARDGRWVTSPDGSGLNLAYESRSTPGAVFARDASGKPLLLPWGQLAALGKGRALVPNETGAGGPVVP